MNETCSDNRAFTAALYTVPNVRGDTKFTERTVSRQSVSGRERKRKESTTGSTANDCL